MLHFSQYVIVLEMSGILDMAALGAADGPVEAASNLKGALQPPVRDDDVEYEGMCRCLVEMLLCKPGMFCELYDKDDKFFGLNRLMVQKIIKLIGPGLMDPSDEDRAFRQPRKRVCLGSLNLSQKATHPPSNKARWQPQALRTPGLVLFFLWYRTKCLLVGGRRRLRRRPPCR